MSKHGKKGDKSRGGGHGGGGQSGGAERTKLLNELMELVQRIGELSSTDAGSTWGAVHKLLLKLKTDPSLVARLIASRDYPGLLALARELGGGEDDNTSGAEVDPPAAAALHPTGESGTDPVSKEHGHTVDQETMRRAMKAFRKRLKLTRLDHESKLGVGPLSGGRRHEVDAILPPREFPAEVWQALVAVGELRDAGRGFYELADEAGRH